MLYLARSKKVVSTTELSEWLKISQRYLMQFTIRLRENHFVHAYTGMNGGYALSKATSDISVYDIIKAMEGDMSIPDCLTIPTDCGKPCTNSHLFESIKAMKEYMETYLKSIMLDELSDMEINGNLNEILELVEGHIGEMKQKVRA